MKNLIQFIIINADVIGTLIISLLVRFVEKPVVKKEAKIEVLNQVIDEVTMPNEEGRARSMSEVVLSVLETLKRRKK